MLQLRKLESGFQGGGFQEADSQEVDSRASEAEKHTTYFDEGINTGYKWFDEMALSHSLISDMDFLYPFEYGDERCRKCKRR